MRLKFSKTKKFFRKINVKVLILLVLGLLPVSQPVYSAPQAQGQTRQFETGDILISVGSDKVVWYNNNGNIVNILQSKIDKQVGGGLAISPFDNNLYLTDFGGPNIAVFNHQDGIFIRDFAAGFDRHSMSIVFDVDGNAFVGDDTYGNVLELNQFGMPVSDFKVNIDPGIEGFAALWLDLAVDQRTLFYSSGGRTIRRFDVVSGQQLKDFAVLPPADPVLGTRFTEHNLRLLYPGDGSGGLLIADISDIKRLDGFGNLKQIYDYHNPEENSWFTLSLDPDGKSFWSSSGTRVFKFDIESGKQIQVFNIGDTISQLSQTNYIRGMTIVGAPLAAQPTVTPTFTPVTPSASPTATSTLTATLFPPTLTPITPTLTSTPPFINPTFPPVATNASVHVSSGFDFPWILIVVGLFVSALIIGGAIMLIRTGRQQPQSMRVNSTKPVPKVRVRGHDDIGNQTLETGLNLSLPKLRLRAGQGEIRYIVQSEDPQQDLGE